MSHPLDNPVWSSLADSHAAFARSTRNAARYPADVAPFVAVNMADADVAEQVACLVDIGESVLFVGLAPPLSSGWSVEPVVQIAQMVCGSRIAINDGQEIVALSSCKHVDDVLALTSLVYPHYFRTRTVEMGRYFGIYDGDMLAAMAGERMGFNGYREISAICTHPAYTGRGHAQRLTAMLANDILDSGRIPFLHVSHQNARAKSLYERLGFAYRADIPLLAARRIGDATHAI